MFSKFTTFLKEVRLETKKVNWPSREETLRNTILVLVFSIVVAAVLGVFDFVFTNILEKLIL